MKLRLGILIGIGMLTTGCQVPYLINNSWHQMRILKQRTDIQKVLKDSEVSEKTKQKLRLVLDVKQFAEQQLGLNHSDNYTTFVDLHRDYVTWIVRAAPKHKLESYQWWFPITGNVPYKGYFTRSGATEEASELKQQGFDTFVRGVTAYSTLGWFEDPVLNTMVRYSDYDLAELIIHETVHATLFIKSNVDFNERLATFIGTIGAAQFFSQRLNGTQLVKQAEQQSNDLKLFSDFITKEVSQLRQWYKNQDSSVSEKIRQEKFKDIQLRYKKQVAPQMKTNHFSGFAEKPLNNAILLSYETYQSNMDSFQKLYDKMDGNFHRFLEYCKDLEKHDNPQKKLEVDARSESKNFY